MTRAFLTAALLLTALPGPPAADDIRVTPLVRDGQVLVSFEAPGALTDELRDAIRSGLVVTFTYGVDLRERAFLWFDRTLGEAELAATVRYDNLSRTYHVSRLTGGTVTWSQTSASEDEIRAWLTSFDRLAVFPGAALVPNTDYEVHVRASVSPRRAWLLWPWGRHDATGRAAFTYIR
jgi:hypothetical protein